MLSISYLFNLHDLRREVLFPAPPSVLLIEETGSEKLETYLSKSLELENDRSRTQVQKYLILNCLLLLFNVLINHYCIFYYKMLVIILLLLHYHSSVLCQWLQLLDFMD